MRRFFAWILRTVTSLLLLLVWLVVLAYPASYLVQFDCATPWISRVPDRWRLSDAEFLQLSLQPGVFSVAAVSAAPLEESAKPNPSPAPEASDAPSPMLASDGYFRSHLGWSTSARLTPPPSDAAWRVKLDLLPWAIGAAILGLFLWGTRATILRFFRRRVRSRYCLHCGHHFSDPAIESCPDCGALRPLVTVSSMR